MTRALNVLLAGESWITHTLHIKGADHFTQSGYGEGVRWLRGALEAGGHTLEHLPAHLAGAGFPATAEELARHDVVILSDIGSNTLLLHPDTAERSLATPNRLRAIEGYVRDGGGLLMIGGYMSFEGIEGKARYGGSPVEEALPVTMLAGRDDRREVPEGFAPRATAAGAEHRVLRGLPEQFPQMLFYNEVRAKPGAEVLLADGDAPVLAVGAHGAGRAAAFTPDAAPHGAPPEFLDWEHFDRFWCQLVEWLAGEEDAA
jgi:uncharacterized membrane protein